MPDNVLMSLVETAQRERALWILKKERYHVLVLSEDNTLLLSEPFKRKKQAKALLEAASSPEQNPAVILGPAATTIPLSAVTDVRVKSSRGFIDLETDEAIHRISGWSARPTIVGGDSGVGYSMFGVKALEDASRRIRSRRRSDQVTDTSVAAKDSRGISDFTTVSTFSYLPPAQVFSFVAQTTLSAALVAVSAALLIWPQPDVPIVLPLVLGLVSGGSLIGSRPPAALEVDHQGIRWGRGRQRVEFPWAGIMSFDIARPADRRFDYRNGLSLFADHASFGDRSNHEIPVAPTHFMSGARLDHFLAAVRYYRQDLTLTKQQIRPAISTKLVPRRSKKAVLENGVKPKSELGRLAIAIVLGFAIPIGLGVLVLVL